MYNADGGCSKRTSVCSGGRSHLSFDILNALIKIGHPVV